MRGSLLPEGQLSTNHSEFTARPTPGILASVLLFIIHHRMFTRWFKTICLKQPSSYMDICVAPSLAKIPSFLNQESPIFWHWTCPAFSLSIQSPCGGSSHDTLLVGDKRNALFSCHSAKSSSEPGMQTSRGSLWTLSPHPSPYWATSREVTRLGKGRFHRIYRWDTPRPFPATNSPALATAREAIQRGMCEHRGPSQSPVGSTEDMCLAPRQSPHPTGPCLNTRGRMPARSTKSHISKPTTSL